MQVLQAQVVTEEEGRGGGGSRGFFGGRAAIVVADLEVDLVDLVEAKFRLDVVVGGDGSRLRGRGGGERISIEESES